MFRWAVIGLLSILCLAMGITVVGSWRSQTNMAAEMRVLAEQLKALAEQQAAVPATLAPLEIAGRVYLGSSDKPAANTEVMICRVGDGEIVRRISTGQTGGYRSGPLPEGDYTVLAKEPKSAPAPRLGFQSAPVYLYPGSGTASVDLDVGHPKCRIGLQLSEPLPKLEVEGKYVIDSRLYFRVEPQAVRRLRWTAKSAMPERWPLYVASPEASLEEKSKYPAARELRSYTVLSDEDIGSGSAVNFLGSGDLLTAGPYRVTALVVADIRPHGESPDVDRPPGFGGANIHEPVKWMSAEWVLRGAMGGLWHSHLLAQRGVTNMGFRSSGVSVSNIYSADSIVDLRAGTLNRLRVEIPTDVVSRFQKLADTITDAEQFRQAVNKEQPFVREAKVTLAATESATAPPASPAVQ